MISNEVVTLDGDHAHVTFYEQALHTPVHHTGNANLLQDVAAADA